MSTASTTDSAQTDIQMRLRRIEGQVRGIIGMVDAGKTCEEVVTQILAARAGMDRVAAEMLKCQVIDVMNEASSPGSREAVLRAINLLAKV